MPKYFLSDDAASDVRSIILYTHIRWGKAQTLRYMAALRKSMRMLARNPGIGRASDLVSPGLRRFEHEKHVVFYRIVTAGIRVSRVLHQRMVPAKWRFEP